MFFTNYYVFLKFADISTTYQTEHRASETLEADADCGVAINAWKGPMIAACASLAVNLCHRTLEALDREDI